MKQFLGIVVFVGGYCAICYVGYLLNRKPGESLGSYLREQAAIFDPIIDDMKELAKGRVFRRK